MVGLIGLVLGGSHVEYVSKCSWTLDSVSTMYLLKLGPVLNSFSRSTLIIFISVIPIFATRQFESSQECALTQIIVLFTLPSYKGRLSPGVRFTLNYASCLPILVFVFFYSLL